LIFKNNKSALSPVIASIILIAVTVAVAVVTATWMGDTTIGLMGNIEKATITNLDFSTPGHIIVTLHNSGNSEVKINNAYLDNAPITTTAPALPTNVAKASTINIDLNIIWASGTQYTIKLTTSKGNTLLAQGLSKETQPTTAFITYRDSTVSSDVPKSQTWNGYSWATQNEMASAGSPIRFVRSVTCPLADRLLENIVVTLSDNGFLDAYVFDGNTVTITNDLGNPGTTVNSYRCFDVAYEKNSGRALLVYSRGTTSNEIGYRTWTVDNGWGNEELLNLPYTSGKVRWISLVPTSGARLGNDDNNEIALIYLDSNKDVFGYVWTGLAWNKMGATSVWDASAASATEECIAVTYEQTTGETMFIWADSVSTDFYYKTWDGSTLSENTLLDIPTTGGVGKWITLKAAPSSDDLFFLSLDAGSDLNTAYWNGDDWVVHSEHDSGVDSNAQRCVDFAWEPSGGKGLLVYGTANGQITRKTFSAPNTWGSPINTTMGTNKHPWVQLKTNTRFSYGDVMILGAVLEANVLDLGSIQWDGTTFTMQGTSTISTNVGIITYESFSLDFQK
jgi:flagellin-like protein